MKKSSLIFIISIYCTIGCMDVEEEEHGFFFIDYDSEKDVRTQSPILPPQTPEVIFLVGAPIETPEPAPEKPQLSRPPINPNFTITPDDEEDISCWDLATLCAAHLHECLTRHRAIKRILPAPGNTEAHEHKK